MQQAVAALLDAAGFEPEGHLDGTAARVAQAWAHELLDGYDREPELGSTFEDGSRGLVVVRDIDFASTCPHHLLPYLGRATVAYLPAGRVAGFSDVVRLVDTLARRLTLQEWLAQDVAQALADQLGAAGAACVVEGVPTCAAARGVRRPCAVRASAFLGALDTPDGRAEVLAAMRGA